jgi:hypothetical protein
MAYKLTFLHLHCYSFNFLGFEGMMVGIKDAVKDIVRETASAAYSSAMRVVSTEASVNARTSDACFKDF